MNLADIWFRYRQLIKEFMISNNFCDDYSGIPDEITKHWLDPLPLPSKLKLRLVSKTFYQIINEMEVQNSIPECKIKDYYLKKVKERFPLFIIQSLNVEEFSKITFKSIKAVSELNLDEEDILAGQLGLKESFLAFRVQEYYKGDCNDVTLIFYSNTPHQAFWHHECVKSNLKSSGFTPLLKSIETFNPSVRYERYKEMLTALFSGNNWQEFSSYTNIGSPDCYLCLSEKILIEFKSDK